MRSFCPCILLSHLSLRSPEEMLSVSSSSFLGACLLADISGNFILPTLPYQSSSDQMVLYDIAPSIAHLSAPILPSHLGIICAFLPHFSSPVTLHSTFIHYLALSSSPYLHFSLVRIFEIFLCHVFSRTLRSRWSPLSNKWILGTLRGCCLQAQRGRWDISWKMNIIHFYWVVSLISLIISFIIYSTGWFLI